MMLVALLSFVALVVASLPPAYFALTLRKQSPPSARVAALLASALLLHAAFHVAPDIGVPEPLVHWFESASALLILAFAVVYWKQREGRAK